MTSLSSITNFFHDDPNVPYTRPPERTLEQSPCYPIIAARQGYFYCRLHPEIKNVHLESIVHNLKYKDLYSWLEARSGFTNHGAAARAYMLPLLCHPLTLVENQETLTRDELNIC